MVSVFARKNTKSNHRFNSIWSQIHPHAKASFGVTVCHQTDTQETLFKRADAAL